MYKDDDCNLALESCFQKEAAQPWTSNFSHTLTSGDQTDIRPCPTLSVSNISDVTALGPRSESLSRSELKFSIREDIAARIQEAASLLMDRDPFSREVGTYEVHTIYLDSPDMAIYRKSLNREADRFKLRMRFYDDDPVSPVFLEIKQNAEGRGTKKRLKVDRESANVFFASASHTKPLNGVMSDEFSDTVRRFNARPLVHIAYVRTAFVGRGDPNTRLTLDRLIRCQPAPSSLTTAMRDPIDIWQEKVILEIKFSGLIPPYLRQLIQSFGLETARTSKYMASVSSQKIIGSRRTTPENRLTKNSQPAPAR